MALDLVVGIGFMDQRATHHDRLIFRGHYLRQPPLARPHNRSGGAIGIVHTRVTIPVHCAQWAVNQGWGAVPW
jgi:hypothetical protein